ncbi:uncharacterized protein ACNLHF_017605 isoform 1-T1 [Anomaloglossus baeobatrachus]|uniref:uncharacterized protein LOC142301214 isoform X1 n=1 Tax=Anomaloglossus baeobatrachus TaxID=238106 RepID=UPI003F5073BA
MLHNIVLLGAVTLLGVLEQAYFSLQVIAARRKYGVSPPSTSGPPEFERVFRAHPENMGEGTQSLRNRGGIGRFGSILSAPSIRQEAISPLSIASYTCTPKIFYACCKMHLETLDSLLEELRPGITFQNTRMCKCFSAEEWLLVTLRFLSTGLSYVALHLEFLLGKSTTSRIVHPTFCQIWERHQKKCMPELITSNLVNISQDIYELCKFPSCVGAVNFKHSRVKKLRNSESQFYNYKQYHSVVLCLTPTTCVEW